MKTYFSEIQIKSRHFFSRDKLASTIRDNLAHCARLSPRFVEIGVFQQRFWHRYEKGHFEMIQIGLFAESWSILTACFRVSQKLK